ncbi:MAG: hypothetical protein R2862_09800 [Thermoanaerobaculia bacterium]
MFRFQNIALARFADAVLVDPDGARVVVVGPFGNDDRVGLARFLENGEVDPSFGDEDTPGRVAAHLKGPTDVRIRDAAIVGSRYRDPFGDDFYSARVSSRWTFEDGFETGSWSLWSNGG